MISARRSHTRINNNSPPYTSTTDRMNLVTLGVPTWLAEGSPKNQVLTIFSLNGELVNDAPARMDVRATKPRTAGCHRKPQPSKGPGAKRPSGV